MYGFELSTSDINRLITAVREVHSYDLSGYVVSPLRQRISEIMKQHAIFSFEELLYRINHEPLFFDTFMKDIAIPETEAFRDSVIWKIIQFDIIKDLYEKISEKIRIWVPASSSGDELFSLLVLLKESCMYEKVHVMTSSLSNKNVENIKTGYFNPKKIEINTANYERFNGKTNLSDYFTVSGTKALWNQSLLSDVEFLKPMSLFRNPPDNIHLILFRNKLIYYNLGFQQKVLSTLHRSLAPEGILILGVKESLNHFTYKDKFTVINEKESIYKKTII